MAITRAQQARQLYRDAGYVEKAYGKATEGAMTAPAFDAQRSINMSGNFNNNNLDKVANVVGTASDLNRYKGLIEGGGFKAMIPNPVTLGGIFLLNQLRKRNQDVPTLTDEDDNTLNYNMGGRAGFKDGEGIIQMASAPDPMDEKNMVMETIAMEEFGKPLKDLSEEEIIYIEIFMDEMSKKQNVSRVMAQQGGRIGAQEGGIMPRLNQLGGGVSSAEQMLQDINQRLESAESSLGGGGAMQPAGLSADVATSAGISPGPQVSNLSAYDQRGPFNVQDAFANAQKEAQKSRAGGFMGQVLLPGEMSFEAFSNMFTPSNNFGQPMQLPASGGLGGGMQSPLQKASGVPAAGYADGGNVVGGEFDFESARQMYGLGKLVKKITKSVKKVAKSPIGKAALLGVGAFGLPGGAFGMKGFLPADSFLRSGITNFFKPSTQTIRSMVPGLTNPRIYERAVASPFSQMFSNVVGNIPGGITGAITGASVLAGLLTPEQEEQAQTIADETGIDIAEIRANPDKYLARRFRAEGGSMDEPVAKKTMPLLDMDGQEMDLRAEGGFVPIGRMEKADDVPARLSKNEFVFTAEAVRNAGEGDVDKGAEVMYNMMKNLESGGEVSEESQGLEGAREMFQTSQRLEEVI